MKKILALFLSVILLTAISVPVFAHNFPSDVNKWTKKDWKKWNQLWEDYWEDYWEEHKDDYYELYYGDSYRVYWDDEKKSKKDEHHSENSCDNPNYNYSYNNYSNYNYYSGIINAYDSGTEDQAIILAKIIYLYAHGISSQTQQACVAWSVMNSIDLSGGNVSVGTVAPNFHYDASYPTVDDFGRDLLPLARDVIHRWKAGRSGISNNGRVLPGGYCYIWSTGNSAIFRNTANETGVPWNFSYASPYGN